MSHVGNIGTRIELIAMDPHFHDASMGLYEQVDSDGAHCFLVHTYSRRGASSERVRRISNAMKALGGMDSAKRGEPALRFPCGEAHRAACRRAFIEACKLDSDSPFHAIPLTVHDKKSQADVHAVGNGAGRYTVTPVDDDVNRRRRAAAIAKGLAKLAEMDLEEEQPDRVTFGCGHAHDPLVGMLLGRAVNVRAAMRETEEAAARGVLAAPSAQGT